MIAGSQSSPVLSPSRTEVMSADATLAANAKPPAASRDRTIGCMSPPSYIALSARRDARSHPTSPPEHSRGDARDQGGNTRDGARGADARPPSPLNSPRAHKAIVV